MWFKNLYLYKFEQQFSHDATDLHYQLEQKPFTPCAPTQRESIGWVPPLGSESSAFTHAANGYILLTLTRQERLLPAQVVRERVAASVADIETWGNRKVGAKEKKELTELIEDDLLPQAFPKTTKMDAFITPDGEWLVIDTPSATRAEAFVTAMRKAVGSVPVVPMKTGDVGNTLTRWLSGFNPPQPFAIGAECELVSTDDDKGVVAFRNHDLNTEEVTTQIENGKLVSKLALEWDGKISFLFTEDFIVKKLKFMDVYEEQMSEEDPQTHEERIDIEFTLMTGELHQLIVQLDKQFR